MGDRGGDVVDGVGGGMGWWSTVEAGSTVGDGAGGSRRGVYGMRHPDGLNAHRFSWFKQRMTSRAVKNREVGYF